MIFISKIFIKYSLTLKPTYNFQMFQLTAWFRFWKFWGITNKVDRGGPIFSHWSLGSSEISNSHTVIWWSISKSQFSTIKIPLHQILCLYIKTTRCNQSPKAMKPSQSIVLGWHPFLDLWTSCAVRNILHLRPSFVRLMWLNKLSRLWRNFRWRIIRHAVQPTVPFRRNLARIKSITVHVWIADETMSWKEEAVIFVVLVSVFIRTNMGPDTKVAFS